MLAGLVALIAGAIECRVGEDGAMSTISLYQSWIARLKVDGSVEVALDELPVEVREFRRELKRAAAAEGIQVQTSARYGQFLAWDTNFAGSTISELVPLHRRDEEPSAMNDQVSSANGALDVLSWSHDDSVAALQSFRGPEFGQAVAAGFVASLSSRQLGWRSALGSWALGAENLTPHHFSPIGSGEADEGLGEVTTGLRFCGVCLEAPCVWELHGPERDNDVDLRQFEFERLKWGGLRHYHLSYARFDLEHSFVTTPVIPKRLTGISFAACSTLSRRCLDRRRHVTCSASSNHGFPEPSTSTASSSRSSPAQGYFARRALIDPSTRVPIGGPPGPGAAATGTTATASHNCYQTWVDHCFHRSPRPSEPVDREPADSELMSGSRRQPRGRQVGFGV